MLKYKKADAQICVIIRQDDIIKVENISIKKSNSNADFNQVDKKIILKLLIFTLVEFQKSVFIWMNLLRNRKIC